MEGIVEWWLLERRIRHAIADVETALRELERKDFLVARECSEGRTYYQLNRAKEREICSYLRRAETAHEQDISARRPEEDGVGKDSRNDGGLE